MQKIVLRISLILVLLGMLLSIVSFICIHGDPQCAQPGDHKCCKQTGNSVQCRCTPKCAQDEVDYGE